MISNMAITRMLSKAEYGLWSFVLNQYSYLGLISGLGLLSGAFQFGVENRNKQKEFEYYRYCLQVGTIIDTLLVFAVLVATFFVDFKLDGAQIYLRGYIPILLLEYILNLLLTVLRSEDRIPEYAKILNQNTILIAAGTCGGAFLGVPGIIVGKYVAYMISIWQVIAKTRDEVRQIFHAKTLKWPETKPLWHYSLFVGATSTMNCLLYLLDVSMIAELLGDPLQIATYKVATLIPTALSFIPNSVIVAILPNIVQHNKDTIWLKTNLRKTFVGMGGFNFLLCFALFVLSPVVIWILSGEQYLPAVPAFRILTISYFFDGTFRLFSTNILAALRHVNYGLFLSIASLLCDIVFNHLFIRTYGMIGAAYATLDTVIVSAILAFGYLLWVLCSKKKKGA